MPAFDTHASDDDSALDGVVCVKNYNFIFSFRKLVWREKGNGWQPELKTQRSASENQRSRSD